MVYEKCGVIGVISKSGTNVSKLIYEGLILLQHRGQESAGIAIYRDKMIDLVKGLGLVTEAIKHDELEKISGFAGIGHVRYSTTGETSIQDAQPIVYKLDDEKYFALAFNGTIANYQEIRKILAEKGYSFKTNTDTEVLAATIADFWAEYGDLLDALKSSMKILDGAYSLVILTSDGEIYAMRDPLGFKPLVIGKVGENFVVASESVAITGLGGEFFGDVEPGEVVKISRFGFARKVVERRDRRAHCMFEYIYFSRPDSIINGKLVYDVRFKLGEILAKLYPVEADIIVPVPDTGVIAALGYSKVSGIPIAMGLVRNPYVGRTFIKPTQKLRELSVQLKLGAVKDIVSGKRIVLIDDSIVRGTTIKWIIGLLRRAGAKEIHVRITCPPIKYPCYMGIDFPMRRELIAAKKSVEEIRKIIGADSLGYMTVEELVKAIGLGEKNLCLACLTGEYPIKNIRIPVLEKIFGER